MRAPPGRFLPRHGAWDGSEIKSAADCGQICITLRWLPRARKSRMLRRSCGLRLVRDQLLDFRPNVSNESFVPRERVAETCVGFPVATTEREIRNDVSRQ